MADLKKQLEKPLYRSVECTRKVEEDGRVPISFSSETPVYRWGYYEILSHKPGAIVLDRAKGGLPFLMDHDATKVVGRGEAVTFTDKGRAMVRFGSGPEAVQAKRDIVDDGIRPDISFGYNILEYTEEKRADGMYLIATKWQPLEISSVGVPADSSVGVNRAKQMPMADDESQEDPNEETAESATEEATEEATETDTKTKKKAKPSAVAGRSQETAMSESNPTAAAAATTTQRTIPAELLTLAADHNVPPAQLRAWAEKSFTVEQAQADLLAAHKAGLRAITQPGAEQRTEVTAASVTTDKDAKEYSYVRAIATALAIREGRKPDNCYELEVSQEISKRLPVGYKSQGSGFYAPMRTQKRAALDSVTATKGTELKFTQYGGELIEILRQQAVTTRLGMRIMSGLTAPIAFPKLTGGLTSYWMPENGGADVTASNNTFGTVGLAPKTLMSRTAYSRQLLNLDVIDTEALVRTEQGISAALAVDKAVFYGLGSAGQPVGIYPAPAAVGVNSKAMGGNPTWAKLVDMVTKVGQANALIGDLNSFGFVTTPGMAGKLMSTLKDSVAGAGYLWVGNQNEGNIAGYRAIASNQISSLMTGSAETGGAEHGIIFGNWGSVMMGTWGVQEIIVDPYSLKNQALIEVTSFQMLDIALRHGESFTKATGATIT